MKCANCERVAHDPVYVVAICESGNILTVNICGHCWNTIYMAPVMSGRLRRLAFKSAERPLPGF